MKLSTEEKIRAENLVQYGVRSEQLLGRIMLDGMDSLTDAEQVEFCLYHYKPKKGMDVQALAERMVEKFGDLADVALLGVKELMQVEGMYRSLAERFTGFSLLLRKYAQYERSYSRTYIRNVMELCRHALPLYRASRLPATWQLCLNEGYELIYQREIAPALAWAEYSGESLTDAEFTGAKYIILVLMCGRQLANPKPYDRVNACLHAQRLEKIGCSLLDIALVDEGKIASMYELGMMPSGGKTVSDRQNYDIEPELRIEI